jgi:hypothetical protein
MGSTEIELASAPRRLWWREHPCYPGFLIWSANVVLAVILGTVAGSACWLLLALPSALFCMTFGRAVRLGLPEVRPDLAERFSRILVDVGGQDAFAVVVQDQTYSPCIARLGRRPTLIAATGFVEDASDEILRGVAAIQHSLLRARPLHRRRMWAKALYVLTIVVVGAGAAVLADRTHSTSVVLAALASVGLSTWLSTAGFAAWSRSGPAASVLAETDRAAAALAGSSSCVADALSAMSSWRSTYWASCPNSVKLLTRCLQPLPSEMHEAERARRLLEPIAPN